MSSAPTWRTRSVIRAVALAVPRMFDTSTIETSFVRSLTSSSRLDSSRRPASVRPNQRSVAPVRSHSSCHGTMFEWCSISEMTISSPGPDPEAGVAALAEAGVEERVRHEVDGLGRVLGEDDLTGRGGADERRDLGPGALVRLGGLRAQRVHGAGDVAVVLLEVRAHDLEHLARLLRGVRRVEVDQRMPVDLTVENREVRPDLLHVEARHVVVLRHAVWRGDVARISRPRRLDRGGCVRHGRPPLTCGCRRWPVLVRPSSLAWRCPARMPPGRRRRDTVRTPRPRAARRAPARPPRRCGRRRRRGRSPA